jgi:hypothetical protein
MGACGAKRAPLEATAKLLLRCSRLTLQLVCFALYVQLPGHLQTFTQAIRAQAVLAQAGQGVGTQGEGILSIADPSNGAVLYRLLKMCWPC